MSLNDRFDFEEGKISADELITRTCAHCKFWYNFVKRRFNYCHKCINNPKIKIKGFSGISIEELYDYFAPYEGEIKKKQA